MLAKVEEKEYCKLHVHYVAEPSNVTNTREKILKDIFNESKKIAFPGFRKGKAPLYIVKVKMKDKIEALMKREMVAKAYDEVLFETKIRPIFYPEVKNVRLLDSQFECNMIFLKKPDFELKGYKGFKIPKPHVEKTSEQLTEELLQTLRGNFSENKPYQENEFIQTKDNVVITVESSNVDLSKENFQYNVGAGYYNEFDNNILGMTIGEVRDFKTPEDVNFKVTLHSGMKNILCPLDDELGKRAGFEDFTQLRNHLQTISNNQITNYEKQQIMNQLVARLLDLHKFEAPEWLTNMEAQQIATQSKQKYSSLTKEDQEVIMKQANERVRLSLILDSIRQTEPEAEFSEREIIDIFKSYVEKAGKDPDKVVAEAHKTGKLNGIVASLQHELTLEWLIDHSEIVE